MSSVGTFVTRLLNIKSPGQFRGHHLRPSDGQTGAEIERRRNAQGLTDRPELRTCQAGCLRGHEPQFSRPPAVRLEHPTTPARTSDLAPPGRIPNSFHLASLVNIAGPLLLVGVFRLTVYHMDERMEGALDRFGETCYHKTQDSLYETENGQNMMVLKAYREGPGGTGSLYYRRFETSGRQRELPSFNLGIHSGAVRKD